MLSGAKQKDHVRVDRFVTDKNRTHGHGRDRSKFIFGKGSRFKKYFGSLIGASDSAIVRGIQTVVYDVANINILRRKSAAGFEQKSIFPAESSYVPEGVKSSICRRHPL